MYCSNCGNQISSSQSYCNVCGTRSSTLSETIAQPDPFRVTSNSGMSCSVPGCGRPVIGQCMGFHSSCGRFYCAQHSHGKLCDECAAELENERVFQEYIGACTTIRKAARKKAWISIGIMYLVLFLVTMPVTTLAQNSSEHSTSLGLPVLLILMIVLLTALFLFFYIPVRSFRKEKVRQLESKKIDLPEIESFYSEWSRSNSRNAWKIAGLVTIGLVAASMPSRTESDVHRIRVKLDSLR